MSVSCYCEPNGNNTLPLLTKQLLQRTCMRKGVRHTVPDVEGDALSHSYYWRGAKLYTDSRQQPVLLFKNETSRQSLIIYVERELEKREKTATAKTRTIARKKERRRKQIDRDCGAES
jgi:hypothetical protein